jgi:mono/diheme cytochrome c family protein
MQWKQIFFILSTVFCFLVFPSISVWTEAQADNSQKNPFAGNAEAIALGKTLYEATCTGYCHSSAGSKRAARCPNLFDCEWKHGNSDGEVFHAVTEGVPKTEMVGFKGKLPDEILWKIIAYLRSASQCQDGNKPAAAAAH